MRYGLPIELPRITLRRGQVIWLLTRLGYAAGVSSATFFEYIKSLRKLGIPSGPGGRSKALANYSYDDVMELAVALSLRVYHTVPDAVLAGLTQHRSRLHQFYGQAYVARYAGKGSPVALQGKGELHGLFLDLGIQFSGGQLVKFGPPRLLTPDEALALAARRMESGQTMVPLNLSAIAERVVELAPAAPVIRPGPARSKLSARRRGIASSRRKTHS